MTIEEKERKYIFTVELKTNEVIGTKEQIAAAFEDIGTVKVIEVKEIRA